MRAASTMEQISHEIWRDAIDEVIEAAMHDQRRQQETQENPSTAEAAAGAATTSPSVVGESPEELSGLGDLPQSPLKSLQML